MNNALNSEVLHQIFMPPLLMEATCHSIEETFRRYICNVGHSRAILLAIFFEKM